MPLASGSIAYLGAARFQGLWRASSNLGTGSGLAGGVTGAKQGLFSTGSSVGGGYAAPTGLTASAGDYWQVNSAGSHNVDGESNWRLNDWCIYSGSAGASGTWQKLAFEDTIASIILGDLSSSSFHMGVENDKHIIFNSGSQHSGSSNFLFDYANSKVSGVFDIQFDDLSRQLIWKTTGDNIVANTLNRTKWEIQYGTNPGLQLVNSAGLVTLSGSAGISLSGSFVTASVDRGFAIFARKEAGTAQLQLIADQGDDSTDTATITVANGGVLDIAASTETVFNEAGNDVDFRVESADESHLIFVEGSTNRVSIGDNTGSPSATLEVKNHASAGATGSPLVQLNSNCVDQIALDINASNTTVNVVDILANDVTSANVINISADGLTTGGGIYIDDNSPDTGARNVVEIKQNNQAATSATALYVDSDGGAWGMSVSKGYAVTGDTTIGALDIDLDKTGASTGTNNIFGVKVDMDNTTATNGTNTMYGLHVTPTLTHAADAGTPKVKGAVITATGGTNGTATATGMELTATGADTNEGLVINCADGGDDLIIQSSADTGDLFKIQVGAAGVTTFTTVDDGGHAADLTLTIDGAIKLDGDGVTVENDTDSGAPALLIDNNDTDAIALDINASNINANVVDVYAPSLTTGFYISCTGSAKTGLRLQQGFSNTGAGSYSIKGISSTIDRQGGGTDPDTIIGGDFDVESVTKTSGSQTVAGLQALSTFGFVAETAGATGSVYGLIVSGACANTYGDVSAYGAKISVGGGTAGSSTTSTLNNVGLYVIAPAIDANDSHILLASQADNDDQFRISVGTAGATTFTTVDDAAAAADLTFTLDGAFDVNANQEVAIDSTAASITVGAALADGQTLKLGKSGAVETIIAPHGTAGSELYSVTNTAGTAVGPTAAAIQLEAAAGGIGIRSAANLEGCIQIEADGGANETISIHSDQGTGVNAKAGSTDASINLISDVGGIGLYSGVNADDAITIEANGGANETIQIRSNQGTGVATAAIANQVNASIALVSDVGGIALASGLNADGSIFLEADGGANETIVIHSNQGTGEGTSNASIQLLSDAGGVDLTATGLTGVMTDGNSDAAVQLTALAGGIGLRTTSNLAGAIQIEADGGAAETIIVKADQSTVDGTAGAGAIALVSDAGGIGLSWNDGKDLWAEGGRAHITANEDAADCIKLHADAGTSQTITVVNDAGTGVAAVGLTSTAGGIALTAGSVRTTHDFATTAPLSMAQFDTDGEWSGTVIKYSPGADDTLNLGQIYYLHTDGTWNQARANAVATGASQMLGIGLGNARSAGVLIKGFIRIPSTEILAVPGSNASPGLPIYIADGTAGHLTFTVPDTSDDFVRIVGYAIQDSTDVLIYFDPDKTWVEIA